MMRESMVAMRQVSVMGWVAFLRTQMLAFACGQGNKYSAFIRRASDQTSASASGSTSRNALRNNSGPASFSSAESESTRRHARAPGAP